ncbi:unnamed protein product [Brassicogethes aeneus]|uniref:Sulfotransferase domain-containing protein n=1 Tax=Brassicogethes aeneus TaxID=1431903 RepID=A0A9P0B938_BRAAE|nr:unnamed protein product [Brassicogethes aeneus]
MECKILKKNPNEVRPLPKELSDILKKAGQKLLVELDLVGPKNYVIGPLYGKYKEEIYNFPIRKNDVWIVTLGRSGTTLMTEMIWQICNNMDFKTGLEKLLIERVPFFEFALIKKMEGQKEKLLKENANDPKKCETIRAVLTPEWEKTEYPETRIYKTHFSLSLLPSELTKEGRVVYVARNPKDMAVSAYHFSNNFEDQPPFEKFWELFEKELIWSKVEHTLEAWNIRHQENVLFLFYEDIVKDMKGTILRVVKFLGKSYTNAEIDKLTEHMKFDNFKKNDSVNKDYFGTFINTGKDFTHVRKGASNIHEELFTKELSERADNWIRENYYKKSDIRFYSVPE